MMRGYVGPGIALVLVLLAGCCGGAAALNATTANATAWAPWEHTYGGVANESLLGMLGAPNGGYRLIGATASGTAAEILLVATDANGTALAETRVPFGVGTPVSACPASGGGVVVAGGTGTAASGTGDVALLGIAADGRRLWSRTYSAGMGRDQGDAVVPATDGGYLVAGVTDLSAGGAPQLLLVKVGEDGGEVWQRTVSLGSRALAVRDLVPAGDGGYLVVGSSDAGRAGTQAVLLAKVSPGGTLEWQRTYAFGAERAEGWTLAPHPSGGWLVLGNAAGTNLTAAAVVVKVGTDGAEQWRKRLGAGGNATQGYALAPIGTAGFAVAGSTGPSNRTVSWVAGIDRNAVEAWNRTFAIGDGPSRALVVANATGGRLAVAGEASRTTELQYDLYLASVTASAAAPNATTNATPTANATADATPTATATATPGTTAPATTQAAPLMLAPLALTAAALAALRRR